MKRKAFVLICLACLLLNVLCFPAGAANSGTCGDNATWSLSDSGVLTVSGIGAIKDYIYEGAETFWEKAPWRKSASSVKKVVVESGITRIGDNAFCCLYNVTSVSIANTVTSIGQAAFADMSSLKKITLPDSVTEVEQGLFHGCKALTSVKLSANLKALSGNMFKECWALKTVEFPQNLTEIPGNAFCHTGLKSLTIPEGIIRIGLDAFKYSEIQTIKLPSTLKEIKNGAFYSSSLTSIVIPASVEVLGRAFGGCYSLKSVRFEGDAPKIDQYAFDNITTTVYYPRDNPTWTESVRQNYDGYLTWVAYCSGGHSWGEWQIESEPSCTQTGRKVRSCTQCDMAEAKTIDKTEHSYQSVVTPPTCQEDGFTTHTCQVCNSSYTDSVTPAGEHPFGDWVITVEATCLKKGSREHSCTVCQLTETEEIDITEHSYRDEVTQPGCTTQGYTTHVCDVCQHTVVDAYTEMTGHSYSEWVTIQSASWFSEGEQHRRCLHCDYAQTEVLPKVPVDWWLVGSVAVVVVAAGAAGIILLKKKKA